MLENAKEEGFSLGLNRSIAGALAGAAGKTLTAPLDRVRIMRQAAPTGFQSGYQILGTIYSADGLRGLWRGNLVNVSRVIPSYAVRFSVFGRLSDYSSEIPLLGNPFVSGALSGLASSIASYPLEVMRTRISVHGTLRDAFNQGRLFAGCSLTILETMPYAGLSLGIYSFLSRECDSSTIATRILHGFVAGAVASVVCFPLDTLRRNKIVRSSESIPAVFRSLVSSGGVSRFYRGVSLAVIKAAPTVALTMVLNDLLLDQLNSHRKSPIYSIR